MHGMGRLRLTVLVQNDGRTALHCASMNGHEECVRLLLDRGACLDVVDVSSWLVVHTYGMAWV
jgi:ankyrin repeat protein